MDEMHGRILRKLALPLMLALGAMPLALPALAQGRVLRAKEIASSRELLGAMNAARAQYGLPALRPSAMLSRPAGDQSAYLAAEQRLDHAGADGSPFWYRFVAAGFPRTRAMGENLGMIEDCSMHASQRIVQLWLASPGHRENLLSRRFHVAGTAVVSANDCGATVYTADFGG